MTASDAERIALYLENIAQMARHAHGHTQDMSRDEFVRDLKTQQAVLRNLTIIGEHAAKLAARFPDFIKRHPEVEWQKARAMRNVIVHAYFRVELPTVWDTVKGDLPKLLGDMERLIANLDAAHR